ncbi:unnamed protein product [Allacma fusca]|uniref:Uncharacterized protein n=1 Tax=Allacma fusca TaxID=39272 RepID=A0A8J2NTH7_9HEXA|nr:unnamed protein product [Allacma fusca]
MFVMLDTDKTIISEGNEDDDDGPAHEENVENYTDDSKWVLPAKSLCVESDDDVVDEDEDEDKNKDEDEYGTPGDSSSAASTEDSSDNAQKSQTPRNSKPSETEISEDPEFQSDIWSKKKKFRKIGRSDHVLDSMTLIPRNATIKNEKRTINIINSCTVETTMQILYYIFVQLYSRWTAILSNEKRPETEGKMFPMYRAMLDKFKFKTQPQHSLSLHPFYREEVIAVEKDLRKNYTISGITFQVASYSMYTGSRYYGVIWHENKRFTYNDKNDRLKLIPRKQLSSTDGLSSVFLLREGNL